MVTFRMDIRKRQGSRTPVDALADILQTNGNFATQRTVCCCTSSLSSVHPMKNKNQTRDLIAVNASTISSLTKSWSDTTP
jgi:hypothetical protein